MQYLQSSALFIYTKANQLWYFLWPPVLDVTQKDDDDADYILVAKPRAPLTRTKKAVIAKPLRDMVWTFYVGQEFSAVCPCCSQQKIDALHFECGHVQAEAAGGLTHLYNLRPICRSCNGSMGKQHMFQFMKKCGFHVNLLQPMNDKAQSLLSDSGRHVTDTHPAALRNKVRRKD